MSNEANNERRITILYGSQTGCAQEVAERIVRDAKRRHFKVKISSMDHYEKSELPSQKLVVFVSSTTGQGDPPDNMKKFWKFLLRKTLPKDSLSNVKIAVFGLGDSSYPKFNFVAKKLYRRLLQLGAKAICRRGDADDQHPYGVDGELVGWMSDFWNEISKIYPLPNHLSALPDDALLPPRYKIIYHDEKVKILHEKMVEPSDMVVTMSNEYSEKHPYFAKLIKNTKITSDKHFQAVHHLEFDIENSGIQYNPGDALAIFPKNPLESVELIIKRLGVNPNQKISIKKLDDDAPNFRSEGTISFFELFEKYLDIEGTPKRYFFELLSHFTDDEKEKERLQYFGSTEGIDDVNRYSHREKRTYVEALADFPYSTPPPEYIFDLIPPLQPRYFSISSSPTLYKTTIHITVAVVQFVTPYKRRRFGLCSNWLSKLDPKSEIRVPIWIKKGQINLPHQCRTPMILVGPGTGMAPFRSFIQERLSLMKNNDKIGQILFFFGNRNKEHDYLYRKEWENYEKSFAPTFRIFTAFSRDQESKVYVQHKIKENAKLVWELLFEKGAVFYIAGNAKQMPIDVKDCLLEIARECGNLPEQEAEEWIKMLENTKRYQLDTWS